MHVRRCYGVNGIMEDASECVYISGVNVATLNAPCSVYTTRNTYMSSRSRSIHMFEAFVCVHD